MLPLIGTVGLGLAALSYAGRRITVVADRDAYPDLDVFTAAVRTELATLADVMSPSVRAVGLRSLLVPGSRAGPRMCAGFGYSGRFAAVGDRTTRRWR